MNKKGKGPGLLLAGVTDKKRMATACSQARIIGDACHGGKHRADGKILKWETPVSGVVR